MCRVPRPGTSGTPGRPWVDHGCPHLSLAPPSVSSRVRRRTPVLGVTPVSVYRCGLKSPCPSGRDGTPGTYSSTLCGPSATSPEGATAPSQAQSRDDPCLEVLHQFTVFGPRLFSSARDGRPTVPSPSVCPPTDLRVPFRPLCPCLVLCPTEVPSPGRRVPSPLWKLGN